MATLRPIARPHARETTTAQFSSDGSRVVSTHEDGTWRLWDRESAALIGEVQAHDVPVSAGCLSSDSRLFVTGALDGSIRAWDLTTKRCCTELRGHTSGIRSLQMTWDSRFAVSLSADGNIRLWHLDSGNCLRSRSTFKSNGTRNRIGSVAVLTPDDHTVLCEVRDGRRPIALWDLRSDTWQPTLDEQLQDTSSLAIAPGGRVAAIASRSAIWLWCGPHPGKVIRIFQHDARQIGHMQFSADGRFLLTGSADVISNNSLHLWDILTNQCIWRSALDAPVRAVDMSFDGRWALAALGDGSIPLFQLGWTHEFPEPSDWHPGADAIARIELARRTPYAGTLPHNRRPTSEETSRALTRSGRPHLRPVDYPDIFRVLQHAGFGWVRKQGMQQQLNRIAAEHG